MTSHALVVYESMFGDARAVAEAIAEGLGERMPARAVPVRQAPRTVGAEVPLLVVGGPNHMFGMPTPASRLQAVNDFDADIPAGATGLREWLMTLQMAATGIPAAAFDTRLRKPAALRLFDHASRTERLLLRELGCDLVAPGEHFFVVSPRGPLATGELDHARQWGRSLAERHVRRTAPPVS